MKTLFLLLLIPIMRYSQWQPYEPQKAPKGKIIWGNDPLNPKQIFEKVLFEGKIPGLIVIDGHTVNNDTMKCPLKYKLTLFETLVYIDCDGVRIEYAPEKCSKKNCKLLHVRYVFEYQKEFTHFNPLLFYNKNDSIKIDTTYNILGY